MTKDYYKILDISEFSTTEEIKTAYRHLARKWHPDVAGNSPDVIAKFKEINEAYEILSDKNRKADYDTAKRFYSYAANGSQSKKNHENHNNAENPNNKKNFSWEDLFGKKEKSNRFRKGKRCRI